MHHIAQQQLSELRLLDPAVVGDADQAVRLGLFDGAGAGQLDQRVQVEWLTERQ
jgi:hypothetical protein